MQHDAPSKAHAMKCSTEEPTRYSYPTILYSPFSERSLSLKVNFATPLSSLSMFPRSPTCRSSSPGAPWFLLNGLKWAPAERHPPDRSPEALRAKRSLVSASS